MSVLVVAVAACGFMLTVGAARLGSAVVARARAETAADAAALAAADALASGRGHEAADAARRRAGANGARLVVCLCSGDAAEVTVELARSVLGGPVRATARAEVGRDPP